MPWKRTRVRSIRPRRCSANSGRRFFAEFLGTPELAPILRCGAATDLDFLELRTDCRRYVKGCRSCTWLEPDQNVGPGLRPCLGWDCVSRTFIKPWFVRGAWLRPCRRAFARRLLRGAPPHPHSASVFQRCRRPSGRRGPPSQCGSMTSGPWVVYEFAENALV